MSEPQSLAGLLRRLWPHVSRRRRVQIAAIGGLTLVATVAELISLGAVVPFLGVLIAPERIFGHIWAQPLIRALSISEPSQLLLPLTVAFAMAAVFAGITRLSMLWAQTKLGSAIGIDLGAAVYRRTLYQSYVAHTLSNSSELAAGQVLKITTVISYVVIPLLNFATSTFIVAVIVSMMIWAEPMLASMTIGGLGGLYVAVAHSSRKRLEEDSRRVALGQGRVTRLVQEGLGGIRDVIIEGLQETYLRIFQCADVELRTAHANLNILAAAPRPVMEALGVVFIAGFAYVTTTRADGMTSAIPTLGALALAAQRLLPLIQLAYAGWTSMLGGQASLADVVALLERPISSDSDRATPTPLAFQKQISLHDVEFRYSADGPWVLRSVSLCIPRGSRVGLIGTTGSGKSTLVDILMCLLPPVSGRLCIDGIAVDDSNRRSWQVHIAHVPQAIYLADSTIADNIAFGVPSEKMDWKRIRVAAEKAQIAATIESWEHGYRTLVGERGIRLSGGQRQRIGIARALYKGTDVIVLDEATSALDGNTEQEVMAAIDSLSGDLTVIVVAHRLTSLKGCDQIIQLEHGRVSRAGTFAEVVEITS